MCQCDSLTWDVEHTEEGQQPRPGRAQQPRQVAGQVQAGRREGRGHSAGLVTFLIKEEMESEVSRQSASHLQCCPDMAHWPRDRHVPTSLRRSHRSDLFEEYCFLPVTFTPSGVVVKNMW